MHNRRVDRLSRSEAWLIAGAGVAWVVGGYAVVDRAAFSVPAPTCSYTARNGGVIWFRRSSIRCSAQPRGKSERGGRARGCSNSR